MQNNNFQGAHHRPRRRIAHWSELAGLIGVFLVIAVGGAPAFAETERPFPASHEAIHPVGYTGPTPAWIKFCEQMPHECAVDTTEPAVVALDSSRWRTIVEVNERVNKTTLGVTDQDLWGVLDRWDYPRDGLGDCEDIQLLKRKMLIEAGMPRRALRMTVVIDDQGEGHAVLMVRTDRGDFILDNKRDAVLPWQKTGYRYVKREGAEDMAWVWLGDQIAPLVTANQ